MNKTDTTKTWKDPYADPEWEAAAERAYEELIAAGKPFTSKDVHDKLDGQNVSTPDKRALGNVTRRYSRKKRIVRTGNYQLTGTHCHPQTEWIGNDDMQDASANGEKDSAKAS